MWMLLMSLLDFGAQKYTDTVLQREYEPLWCIYTAVKQSKMIYLDSNHDSNEKLKPTKLSYHDICCIYILNNVNGLSSKIIVDQYTSMKLKTNVFMLTNNILSALADNRSSSMAYMNTIHKLLTDVVINISSLQKHIHHYVSTADLRKESWLLKNVQARYYTLPMFHIQYA